MKKGTRAKITQLCWCELILFASFVCSSETITSQENAFLYRSSSFSVHEHNFKIYTFARFPVQEYPHLQTQTGGIADEDTPVLFVCLQLFHKSQRIVLPMLCWPRLMMR